MSPKVSITLDGGMPFVGIELFDANYSDVKLSENLGRTTVDVTPGLYFARFSTSIWHHVQRVFVLPDVVESQIIRPPLEQSVIIVDSAAPLERTNAFLADDADLARRVSRETASLVFGESSEGSLFIMIRRRPLAVSGDKCSHAPFLESPFSLISLTASADLRDIDLKQAWREDLMGGWACAHLALPAGSYRLQFGASENQEYITQFIFIPRGYQTQVFLTDRSLGAKKPYWGSSKFSVHFSNLGNGFDPESTELLATEEVCNLIGTGRHFRISEEIVSQQLNGDMLVPSYPMLNLVFGLCQIDPWALTTTPIRRGFKNLCGWLPGVTDAFLLWNAYGPFEVRAGDAPSEDYDPPMFVRSWDLALSEDSRGALDITSNSVTARLATRALTVGPWLRFADLDKDEIRSALEGDRTDAIVPELELSEPGIKDLFSDVRRTIARNMSRRIHLRSGYFSPAERLFIELTCPEANTIVRRLLSESGSAVQDSMPTEDTLVRSLRLPRASVQHVAINAISKLFGRSFLPDVEQLDDLISEESRDNAVLYDPLTHLKEVSSGILHITERVELSLLAVIFVRYRGARALEQGHGRLLHVTRMLSNLGFVVGSTRKKLQPAHVSEALAKAGRELAMFYATRPIEEPSLEAIEIKLVSPSRYKLGNLCLVRIYAKSSVLPKRLEQEWNENAISYSLSLTVANGRSLQDRPEGAGKKPLLPRPRIPFGGPGQTRAFYFRTVLDKSHNAIDSTLALLDK